MDDDRASPCLADALSLAVPTSAPGTDRRASAEVEQALLRAGPSAVVSHELAAAAWGIELLDEPQRRLTVPRNSSRVHVAGWQVVRRDLHPSEVELVDGVRTTAPLRTVADLCRVLSFVAAVAAADSGLRQGLLELESATAALLGTRGRGARALRAVAGAVDPLSGSVLETVLRLLLLTGPFPPAVTQFPIRDRDGHLVARADFCWPAARLVVEADGFAFHSDRAAYRRDRERLNALERLGWRVLRFTWEDVMSRPEHVLAAVAECLAAGQR